MPYLNMIPFASGNTLETMTKDATATSDKILDNETAYVNGKKITGNMPNQGSKSSSLNCDESYNIPEGYHDGTGVISANSLASQTSATATASDIATGKTAWVDGNQLTGTLEKGKQIDIIKDFSGQRTKSLSISSYSGWTHFYFKFRTSDYGGMDVYLPKNTSYYTEDRIFTLDSGTSGIDDLTVTINSDNSTITFSDYSDNNLIEMKLIKIY